MANKTNSNVFGVSNAQLRANLLGSTYSAYVVNAQKFNDNINEIINGVNKRKLNLIDYGLDWVGSLTSGIINVTADFFSATEILFKDAYDKSVQQDNIFTGVGTFAGTVGLGTLEGATNTFNSGVSSVYGFFEDTLLLPFLSERQREAWEINKRIDRSPFNNILTFNDENSYGFRMQQGYFDQIKASLSGYSDVDFFESIFQSPRELDSGEMELNKEIVKNLNSESFYQDLERMMSASKARTEYFERLFLNTNVTDAIANGDKGAEMARGVFGSIGRMIPSIVLAKTFGIVGKGLGLKGQALQSFLQLGKVSSQAIFAGGVFGMSMQEAINNGASYDDALTYSIATMSSEMILEQLGGVVLGEGSGVRNFATFFKQMFDEGMEEAAAELLAGGTSRYSTRDNQIGETYRNESAADFFARVATSALLGAASGGVMGLSSLVLSNMFVGGASKLTSTGASQASAIETMLDQSVEQGDLKTFTKEFGQRTTKVLGKLNKMDIGKAQKVVENNPIYQDIFSEVKNKSGEVVGYELNEKANLISSGQVYGVDSKGNNILPSTHAISKLSVLSKLKDKVKIDGKVVNFSVLTNEELNTKANPKQVSEIKNITSKVGNVVFVNPTTKSKNTFSAVTDLDTGIIYVNVNQLEKGVSNVVAHEINDKLAYLSKQGKLGKQASRAYSQFVKAISNENSSVFKQLTQDFDEAGYRQEYAGRKDLESLIATERVSYFIQNVLDNETALNSLANKSNKTFFEKVVDFAKFVFGVGGEASESFDLLSRKVVSNEGRVFNKFAQLEQKILNIQKVFESVLESTQQELQAETNVLEALRSNSAAGTVFSLVSPTPKNFEGDNNRNFIQSALLNKNVLQEIVQSGLPELQKEGTFFDDEGFLVLNNERTDLSIIEKDSDLFKQGYFLKKGDYHFNVEDFEFYESNNEVSEISYDVNDGYFRMQFSSKDGKDLTHEKIVLPQLFYGREGEQTAIRNPMSLITTLGTKNVEYIATNLSLPAQSFSINYAGASDVKTKNYAYDGFIDKNDSGDDVNYKISFILKQGVLDKRTAFTTKVDAYTPTKMLDINNNKTYTMFFNQSLEGDLSEVSVRSKVEILRRTLNYVRSQYFLKSQSTEQMLDNLSVLAQSETNSRKPAQVIKEQIEMAQNVYDIDIIDLKDRAAKSLEKLLRVMPKNEFSLIFNAVVNTEAMDKLFFVSPTALDTLNTYRNEFKDLENFHKKTQFDFLGTAEGRADIDLLQDVAAVIINEETIQEASRFTTKIATEGQQQTQAESLNVMRKFKQTLKDNNIQIIQTKNNSLKPFQEVLSKESKDGLINNKVFSFSNTESNRAIEDRIATPKIREISLSKNISKENLPVQSIALNIPNKYTSPWTNELRTLSEQEQMLWARMELSNLRRETSFLPGEIQERTVEVFLMLNTLTNNGLIDFDTYYDSLIGQRTITEENFEENLEQYTTDFLDYYSSSKVKMILAKEDISLNDVFEDGEKIQSYLPYVAKLSFTKSKPIFSKQQVQEGLIENSSFAMDRKKFSELTKKIFSGSKTTFNAPMITEQNQSKFESTPKEKSEIKQTRTKVSKVKFNTNLSKVQQKGVAYDANVRILKTLRSLIQYTRLEGFGKRFPALAAPVFETIEQLNKTKAKVESFIGIEGAASPFDPNLDLDLANESFLTEELFASLSSDKALLSEVVDVNNKDAVESKQLNDTLVVEEQRKKMKKLLEDINTYVEESFKNMPTDEGVKVSTTPSSASTLTPEIKATDNWKMYVKLMKAMHWIEMYTSAKMFKDKPHYMNPFTNTRVETAKIAAELFDRLGVDRKEALNIYSPTSINSENFLTSDEQASLNYLKEELDSYTLGNGYFNERMAVQNKMEELLNTIVTRMKQESVSLGLEQEVETKTKETKTIDPNAVPKKVYVTKEDLMFTAVKKTPIGTLLFEKPKALSNKGVGFDGRKRNAKIIDKPGIQVTIKETKESVYFDNIEKAVNTLNKRINRSVYYQGDTLAKSLETPVVAETRPLSESELSALWGNIMDRRIAKLDEYLGRVKDKNKKSDAQKVRQEMIQQKQSETPKGLLSYDLDVADTLLLETEDTPNGRMIATAVTNQKMTTFNDFVAKYGKSLTVNTGKVVEKKRPPVITKEQLDAVTLPAKATPATPETPKLEMTVAETDEIWLPTKDIVVEHLGEKVVITKKIAQDLNKKGQWFFQNEKQVVEFEKMRIENAIQARQIAESNAKATQVAAQTITNPTTPVGVPQTLNVNPQTQSVEVNNIFQEAQTAAVQQTKEEYRKNEKTFADKKDAILKRLNKSKLPKDKSLLALYKKFEDRVRKQNRSNSAQSHVYNHVGSTVYKIIIEKMSEILGSQNQNRAIKKEKLQEVASEVIKGIYATMDYIDSDLLVNINIANDNPKGFLYTKAIHWYLRDIKDVSGWNEQNTEAFNNDSRGDAFRRLLNAIYNFSDKGYGFNELEGAMEEFFRDSNVEPINDSSLQENQPRTIDTIAQQHIENIESTNDIAGKIKYKRSIAGLIKNFVDPFTIAEIIGMFNPNSWSVKLMEKLIQAQDRMFAIARMFDNIFDEKTFLDKYNKQLVALEKNPIAIVNLGNAKITKSQVMYLKAMLVREILTNRAIDLGLRTGVKTNKFADGFEVEILGISQFAENKKKGKVIAKITNAIDLLTELDAIIENDSFMKLYESKTKEFFASSYNYINERFKEINGLNIENVGEDIFNALATATQGEERALFKDLPKSINAKTLSSIYVPFLTSKSSYFKAITDINQILDVGVFDGMTQDIQEDATNMVSVESITNIVSRYRQEVMNYYGMHRVMRDFNAVMNYSYTKENGQVQFIKGMILEEQYEYFARLMTDMAGYRQKQDMPIMLRKWLPVIRSNFYTGALGFNVKVLFTQFASFLNLWNIYGDGSADFLGNMTKNLIAQQTADNKVKLQDLMNTNNALWDRSKGGSFELGEATLEGARGKNAFETLKQFSMKGIVLTDNMINKAFYLTLLESVNPNTGVIYTPDEASETLTTAIYRSQSNKLDITKAAILRNQNEVVRMFLKFLGEPSKIASQIIGANEKVKLITKLEQARTNIESSANDKVLVEQEKLDLAKQKLVQDEARENSQGFATMDTKEQKKIRQEIKESSRAVQEQERKLRNVQTQAKNVKTQIKKAISEKAKAKRQYKQAVAALFTSVSYMALLSFTFGMVRTAGGEKDKPEEEELWSHIAKKFGTAFLEEIIGMMPVVRDFYGVVNGFDLNQIDELTPLNNLFSDVSNLFLSMIGEKQINTNRTIYSIIKNGSQLFGIPFRNMERLFTTPLLYLSEPTWYKYNVTIGARNRDNIDLAEAIKNNDTSMVGAIIDNKINKRAVLVSTKIRDEIKRLASKGYEVSMTGIPTSIKIGNTTRKLTQAERKEFADVYNKADSVVQKMLSSGNYRRLNDEYKARLVRAIYAYYYKLAKQEVFEIDTLSENLTFTTMQSAFDYFNKRAESFFREQRRN